MSWAVLGVTCTGRKAGVFLEVLSLASCIEEGSGHELNLSWFGV